MATEIIGGNAQVGTLNRQFIETNNSNNNNNNNVAITINVVHCTASHQHQHQEGVSISGGDVPQLKDALKSVVALCSQTPQIASESTIQTQSEATRKYDSVPATQTAVTDSVRIEDSYDQVLEPGDAVFLNIRLLPLYVGDGYVVYYNEDSQIVVKERLDLTQPFRKWTPLLRDNVNVYPPEQRVQRVLQHVGKPCPVPDGDSSDFIHWTYTGLNFEQCVARGIRLFW